MSILNLTNDGIYPELIVLFKVVAIAGKSDPESLVKSCTIQDSESGERSRLWAVLKRWSDMGLFISKNDSIELNPKYKRAHKQTIDESLRLLPKYCNEVLFEKKNSDPLWGEGEGTAADLTRALAWLLAQDIYSLPTSGWSSINPILNAQMSSGKTLIQNDTRWTGLRAWARFLGFSVGASSDFFVDPTSAIKAQLPDIFGEEKELSAEEFIKKLTSRLPVLDYGIYRDQVEKTLNLSAWRAFTGNNLSMSLSFALRRLDAVGSVRLEGRVDAGSSYRLTKSGYDSWGGFEAVIWSGSKQ